MKTEITKEAIIKRLGYKPVKLIKDSAIQDHLSDCNLQINISPDEDGVTVFVYADAFPKTFVIKSYPSMNMDEFFGVIFSMAKRKCYELLADKDCAGRKK